MIKLANRTPIPNDNIGVALAQVVHIAKADLEIHTATAQLNFGGIPGTNQIKVDLTKTTPGRPAAARAAPPGRPAGQGLKRFSLLFG